MVERVLVVCMPVGVKRTKSPYQKYGLFQVYKRATIDTKRTLLIIKNEQIPTRTLPHLFMQ